MSLSSGIEQQAARSLTSVHHISSPSPSIELNRVKHADAEPDTKGVVGVQGEDLERSSTKKTRAQTDSLKKRKRLEVQYGCLCLALFLAGWNDGTNGPLIPRIRDHYNVSFITISSLPLHSYPIAQVNFTLVSLIFIANCVVSA